MATSTVEHPGTPGKEAGDGLEAPNEQKCRESAPAGLPDAPVTLPADEYLRFLQMIEGGMPEGTRAYLVSIDHDTGKRKLWPVPRNSSVIDLDSDLIQHLDATLTPTATLRNLADYCARKLKLRKATVPDPRMLIAAEATYEIEVLVSMLLREARRDSSEFDILLPSTLRRIVQLNSVAMSVAGSDDGRELAEMQEVVHGEAMEADHAA